MKSHPDSGLGVSPKTGIRFNGLFLTGFLSYGIALYAIAIYGFTPLGSVVHPDMRASFIAHPLAIYAHAFGASIALLIGPLQFYKGLRQKKPMLHRWLGRIYLTLGVGVGGIAGLYMAIYAYGGWIAQLGFATLAVTWIYTGIMAYRAIRLGAVDVHRQWMLRNFSLAFAAVMLRVYLPIMLVIGLDFQTAYAVVAWLAWIPNLVFVQRFIISRSEN